MSLPAKLVWTCRRLTIRPSRNILVVQIAAQRLLLFQRFAGHANGIMSRTRFAKTPISFSLTGAPTNAGTATSGDGGGNNARSVSPFDEFQMRRRYCISTSRFGVGQHADSNRTPLGLHRVAEKIGGGQPIGTVFRSRQPVGLSWQGQPEAPIAHRILWLAGLEPGFNQGEGVDSHERYIYIHGVGDETTLGRPASRGCIHMAAADLLPLYDVLPVGALVWITDM